MCVVLKSSFSAKSLVLGKEGAAGGKAQKNKQKIQREPKRE